MRSILSIAILAFGLYGIGALFAQDMAENTVNVIQEKQDKEFTQINLLLASNSSQVKW